MDRVQEAREAVLRCGGLNWREETNTALDALISAVRESERMAQEYRIGKILRERDSK